MSGRYVVPGLIEKVVHGLEQGDVGFDMGWWGTRQAQPPTTFDPRVALPSAGACGTVACLAGHVVIQAGATLLFDECRNAAGLELSERCRWHLDTVRISTLATKIWKATYPDAPEDMFAQGMYLPHLIARNYGEGVVTLAAIERFMKEAAGLLPVTAPVFISRTEFLW